MAEMAIVVMPVSSSKMFRMSLMRPSILGSGVLVENEVAWAVEDGDTQSSYYIRFCVKVLLPETP